MRKEKHEMSEKALYRPMNTIKQCIVTTFQHANVKRRLLLKETKNADVLCNEVDKYRSEYLVMRIHRT